MNQEIMKNFHNYYTCWTFDYMPEIVKTSNCGLKLKAAWKGFTIPCALSIIKESLGEIE